MHSVHLTPGSPPPPPRAPDMASTAADRVRTTDRRHPKCTDKGVTAGHRTRRFLEAGLIREYSCHRTPTRRQNKTACIAPTATAACCWRLLHGTVEHPCLILRSISFHRFYEKGSFWKLLYRYQTEKNQQKYHDENKQICNRAGHD